MRFLKGSKVEVLKNKQVPPGAWHCAKIISGNGHTYSVMYEGSLEKTAKAVVDSVPRKDIRPRPPPMETMEGWAVGDVAEVFDVGCGRMDSEGFVNLSSVLAYSNHEILKGDVMYEGSLEKTAKAVVDSVPRKDIRPRPPPMETMEGWAVGDVAEVFDVGCGRMDSEVKNLCAVLKCLAFLLLGSWGSQNCELVKFNKPSSLNCHQMTPEFPQLDTRRKTQAGNTCLAAQDNICLQESHIVSSRTLKRASPYCSFHTEGYSGKMRAIENEGECQRVISEFPSPLLKKVDAVAFPQGRNSEPIHCDSDASSVGSCSVVTNSPNRLSGDLLTCSAPDCDTLSSDADSYYDCRDEEGKCFLSPKDSVATSIHRLELHDY
nr:uncharacterized protein LOC112003958 [Quercus suber]